MMSGPLRLLVPQDPAPVVIRRGGSPFVIVADHAGRVFPQRLGTLGLPDAELERHIAWDIGAGAVATRVAEALDASLLMQSYSRLVIDCNRPLSASTSIAEMSERTSIPGNVAIGQAEREVRVREIFEPYHRAITSELDRRREAGEPTVLIALHSFTPVFMSIARPWHVGTLYRHPHFAGILLDLLRAEPDLVVGDNQPYAVSDVTDYTIPVHGERRGLPHTGIEIRQDLIGDETGQQDFARLLARLLPRALALWSKGMSAGRN
jgi:predicted N-formylglutamate amidohydrolase